MAKDKTYWEFTGETRIEFGVELKQIRAVCDFGFVTKGDLGGWISDAVSLAQNGLAWIGKNAKAFQGTIWGGTIEGGTIWGGTIRGGTIRGGTIRGGTIRGGTIRGGTIEGGTIRGGTIEGGTIWGGDFLTISPIGSENGLFTAEITKDGQIICNRGCFSGTLDAFGEAVLKNHGENNTAQEYNLVIDLVKTRLGPIAEKRARDAKAGGAE